MFEHNLDFTFVFFEHLLEKRLKLAAVGSLEVGEHRDDDRRIVGPFVWGAGDVYFSDKVKRY